MLYVIAIVASLAFFKLSAAVDLTNSAELQRRLLGAGGGAGVGATVAVSLGANSGCGPVDGLVSAATLGAYDCGSMSSPQVDTNYNGGYQNGYDGGLQNSYSGSFQNAPAGPGGFQNHYGGGAQGSHGSSSQSSTISQDMSNSDSYTGVTYQHSKNHPVIRRLETPTAGHLAKRFGGSDDSYGGFPTSPCGSSAGPLSVIALNSYDCSNGPTHGGSYSSNSGFYGAPPGHSSSFHSYGPSHSSFHGSSYGSPYGYRSGCTSQHGYVNGDSASEYHC